MEYKVYVKMKFGIDDTFDAEYSGETYTNKKEAIKELKEAKNHCKNDNDAIYAYIETSDYDYIF